MYCNGAKAEIEFSFLKPENHFAHLGYSAADCPVLGTEFSRGVWCPIKDSTECLLHAGLCSRTGRLQRDQTAEVPAQSADAGGGDHQYTSESNPMSSFQMVASAA